MARKSDSRPKSSRKKRPLKVRSNGKLRQAAGVNKRTGKVKKSNVKKLAKGSGKSAKRARFYLNVLSKGSKKGRKK